MYVIRKYTFYERNSMYCQLQMTEITIVMEILKAKESCRV